jgi:hypothetical protein
MVKCQGFGQGLIAKIGLRYNNTWNFFTFIFLGNKSKKIQKTYKKRLLYGKMSRFWPGADCQNMA